MPLPMSRPWKHPSSGVYWLRKGVPEDIRALVGKREEKRSLHTRDPIEAKRLHAQALAEIEAKWANLRSGQRSLTEREAHHLAAPFYDRWLQRYLENPSQQTDWRVDLGLRLFQPSPASLDVRYRLFCHFPGSTGMQKLARADLDTIVATKAAGLLPIVNRIKPGVDLDGFLARFEIEFGPSVEEYQIEVLAKLATKGFSAADIDAIIYPAAFQRIVDAATQKSVVTRTIDPVPFLASLKDVRRVTFTRWARELSTRAQIFKRLRSELKDALDQNSRARHFVVAPHTIEDFDKDVVRFIKAFVEKYSFKYLHDNPPLFALTGCYDVGGLQVRLHDAGLKCATGLVGNAEVRLAELLRTPMIQRKPKVMLEFRLRLAARSGLGSIGANRPDELFLVNVTQDDWESPDINVHKFEIDRLSDLEYALQLRREYD